MADVYQRPPTDSVRGSGGAARSLRASGPGGGSAPALAPTESAPDPDRGPDREAGDAQAPLPPQALLARLEEEIARAQRHGTALGCLLMRIDDLPEIADAYGPELAERTLSHAGQALRRELRRFDRVGRPLPQELAVLLPGAGQSQGEAVARRALRRLQAIKIEVGRLRRPLACSVGIAAWRAPWDGPQLLAHARAAADASAVCSSNNAGAGDGED